MLILETERLYLREMTQSDFPALCRILQDDEVMYAYEGAFSDAEVQDWLDRQLRRYREDKVGLWAVVLKATDTMIGQCGLTLQPWKERKLLEVGYLFQKAFWHCGYATEAAQACRDYAFETLHAEAVYSIIRDTNTASRRVAERNGMTVVDQGIKHYRGIDMPHVLYVLKKIRK
jgi:Acetyltransferases, including N-acetylases of ribosomal proteins